MRLDPNFALQSEEDALFIDGIGPIAQYHCYCEMLYSHGVIYFLRDSLSRQINLKITQGVQLHELQPEIRRLDTLNSNILAYETQYANHNPGLRTDTSRSTTDHTH